MYPSYYKYCIVPQCKSTSLKTPDKLFVYVPNKPRMRRKWLKLARRDGVYSLSTYSRMYFCEDHFDLPNDMLNYTEYHIMGKVSRVRMKPGCTPSKFECQEDRTKRTCSSTERQYILKKQRITTIAECLNKPDESPTSSSPTDNPHTSSESTRGNSCFTHFGHNTWDHTYATMDFPSIVCVKQEPESNESADVIKEEPADVIKEEGGEGDEAAEEASGSAGARGSEAAMLAALYADHVVKDELVLGPEVPHRPHITSLHESTTANSFFTHFGHNAWDHTYAKMDLPSKVCVKQEPESNESADVIKEELADVIKEEGGEGDEAAEEASGSAGARGSEAAMLAALYADHVVKDDPVLGLELPHRPHITSLHDARGVSGGAWREPRGGQLALKDCSVRLERCDAPRGAATREPAPGSRAPAHGTAPHTRADLNAANTYVCDICGKIFKRKCGIIRHVNGHSRKNSEVLSNKLRIYECVRASVKPYACDICNKVFSTLGNLRRHQREVCVIYGKVKKRKNNLNSHVNCEICNKKLSGPNILQRHRRVHTGQKPYSCEICEKKFTESGTLRAHKRIHTEERPYSCDICIKKFSSLDDLQRHGSIHTGEKLYSCEICQKKFAVSGPMKAHKRIHSGEKPYSCDICKKQFAYSSGMKQHKRSHTGEKQIRRKSYSCELCKKAFSCFRSLKSHKLDTHLRGRPYTCEEGFMRVFSGPVLITSDLTSLGP